MIVDVAFEVVVGIAGAVWSKIRPGSPRGPMPDRSRSINVAAARVRAAQLQRWTLEQGLALESDHQASGVLAGLPTHIEWEVLPNGLNQFELRVACKLPLTHAVRIDGRNMDEVERSPLVASVRALFELPALADLVRSVELTPASVAVRCFDVLGPELAEILFEELVQLVRAAHDGGTAYRDR